VGGPKNGLRGGSTRTRFFIHNKAQKAQIISSSFMCFLCFFVAHHSSQLPDKLSKHLEEAIGCLQ
jgi:hypothetical protein